MDCRGIKTLFVWGECSLVVRVAVLCGTSQCNVPRSFRSQWLDYSLLVHVGLPLGFSADGMYCNQIIFFFLFILISLDKTCYANKRQIWLLCLAILFVMKWMLMEVWFMHGTEKNVCSFPRDVTGQHYKITSGAHKSMSFLCLPTKQHISFCQHIYTTLCKQAHVQFDHWLLKVSRFNEGKTDLSYPPH